MYCMRCGAKLPDATRYCTSCGAPTVKPKHLEQKGPVGAVNQTEAEASKDDIKTAIGQTKMRSMKRIPPIILIALAMILAAGAAFAAYRVYTDIVAPTIQENNSNRSAQSNGENPPTAASNDDADELDQNTEAFRQYKTLLENYEHTYGGVCTAMPDTLQLVNGVSEETGRLNIGGLCFAYLVDFDENGTDELVCTYYDESRTDAIDLYRYVTEIWGYEPESGEIRKIASLLPNHIGNNGFECIGLVKSNGRPCVCSRYEPENLEKSDTSRISHICIETTTVENGQEKKLDSIIITSDYSGSSPKFECTVNGEKVTQEEGASAQSRLFGSIEPIDASVISDSTITMTSSTDGFRLNWFESEDELEASSTVIETNKTLDKLATTSK